MKNAATRREFVGGIVASGLAASLDARAYSRVVGANERVAMAVVGCGGRGRFVTERLLENGADITFLCDPDPAQIAAAQKLLPSSVDSLKDFRAAIDRKETDAVLIATPDHWHALPFIYAVEAGKDVYQEKPTALTIAESRAMVIAAKKTGSIVQIGTQQKSGEHYHQAVAKIKNGEIGTVSHARFWNVFNNAMTSGGGRAGGIGNPPDGNPPKGVDYDLWLGPAPARPFNPNRFHWNYAYFWDYSGGMMSGWGVHHMDIIHWALDLEAPSAVSASGGKFVLTDNRETPDTLDALFEYEGVTVEGSIHHANSRLIEGRDYGIAFYGSEGTLVIDRDGYEVWPEPYAKTSEKFPGSPQDGPHARNFLDAVRSRKTPFADIETGHHSSIPCLLANISYRTGRKLRWDAVNERFVDDAEADEYLARKYREPWTFPSQAV